jgi:hypothetical protein
VPLKIQIICICSKNVIRKNIDFQKNTAECGLDNNITETHMVELELWNTVDVELYSHEAEIPMAINIMTV